MGQDNSKGEGRAHHRKVLPSSMVAPSKESQPSDKKGRPSITFEHDLESSHSVLENSLSLFATSPSLTSPHFSKLCELFGGDGDSAEDSDNFEISLTSNISETPSLLTVLSTSVPSENFLQEQTDRRPSLPSPTQQSLSTPDLVQRHRKPRDRASHGDSFEGVVTVVESHRPSEDPILIRLKSLPKYPSSFSNLASHPTSSSSHSSVLSSATFPFPGLWARSSPGPKPPRLQVTSSESFDGHLKHLASAYQTHTRTACRLLLRNQLKLVAEIKDAEASCSHIATYTAPHLNHLKESHAQFATILEDLKEEVTNTRLLLKGLFKSLEKINSFFPQSERIGYLKYQEQEQYPNLHQAYRKAKLKGSAPQFTTRPTGSGILGRRRRESAVVLTLDSVLSERHRPYSTTYGEYTTEQVARPLSSTSRSSLDEFGLSASQRLYDIATSRPPTSVGYRTYTPSVRTSSPSLRHSASASTPAERVSNSPMMSPIKLTQDLESLLLLPSDLTSNPPSNYSAKSPNDFPSFNGLFVGISSKVSLGKE